MLRPLATLFLAVSMLVPASTPVAAPVAEAAPGRYATRADVRAFIGEMADEHGFDRKALSRLFAQARYQRAIVDAMDRPLREPPKWFEYARPFLARERVEAGAAYWAAHADDLSRAAERFGVPAEVVVAILGIETYYGRYIGNYRTVDALATLAFDYPRRAGFFRGELKQFLLLARELGMKPLAAKGSFAGAMGVPQFMPGSYRSFAIDFDGTGRADLWTSPADIVGSVANYLARHDWQRGQPVLLTASIAESSKDTVLRKLDGGLSERRALDAWAADGVTPTEPTDGLAPDPVGLLLLEQGPDGAATDTYWIACNNFYVLTRYNRSRLYATAVWELAKAIKAARAAAGG
jgi:membrane-bound lytic murein transglycosylase B